MSKLSKFLVALAGVSLLLPSAWACDDDAWDDLPDSVATFFSNYFPGVEVDSWTIGETRSVATVKNGVTVAFNSGDLWIDVNGNGIPLPEVFLYDQLPENLYRYLQELEATNGVYRVSRDAVEYSVKLLDSYVRYNTSDGRITGPLPVV